jgi:hypothetical protein
MEIPSMDDSFSAIFRQALKWAVVLAIIGLVCLAMLFVAFLWLRFVYVMHPF